MHARLPRILVVAQDSAASKHLEQFLEGDGELSWEFADSFPAGLARLSEQRFDVVLLDLAPQDPARLDRVEAIREGAESALILTTSGEDDGAAASLSGMRGLLYVGSLNTKEDVAQLRHTVCEALVGCLRHGEAVRKSDPWDDDFRLLRLIVEHNHDGMILVDHEGTVMLVNQSACVSLNQTRGELVGSEFGFPVAVDRRSEIDIPMRDGEPRVAEMLVAEVKLDENVSTLIALRDITDLARLRDHLQTAALVDELTGLVNRRGWSFLAQHQLLLAQRERTPVMVLYADLDNLKRINDAHGHAAGDEALVAFARALRATFRESDLVARMGGDEFAVLPIDAAPESEGLLRARLERTLMEAAASARSHYRLEASIGIAYWSPESGQTLDDVLGLADERMYAQKRKKPQGPKVDERLSDTHLEQESTGG